MSTDLYSIHETTTPGEYIIQKFDSDDYTCESVYALTSDTCMCPQGHKPLCKHRKMLELFRSADHIGDGFFLEWQTRLWHKPVKDLGSPFEMDKRLADETVMGTSAGEE